MVGVITVTHVFVSQLEDSPDAAAAGELVPSNWNDDHVVEGVAPLDGAALISPTVNPTPAPGDSSDLAANTQFVTEAIGTITAPARKTLTAGSYAVADGIGYVVVKLTVPAAVTITLPLSTDENAPEVITIKDRMLAAGTGQGAGTFNIAISPSGDETLDGNSSATIDVDNMALSFRKIRNDAGAITGEGYELV